jgi:hypothetical protein
MSFPFYGFGNTSVTVDRIVSPGEKQIRETRNLGFGRA